MLCRNCRYWNTEEDYNYKVPKTNKAGICTRVRLLWDCTEWDHDGCSSKFTEEAEGELAFVQDGSDYSADLITL